MQNASKVTLQLVVTCGLQIEEIALQQRGKTTSNIMASQALLISNGLFNKIVIVQIMKFQDRASKESLHVYTMTVSK